MNNSWNVCLLAQVFAVSFSVSIGSVLAAVRPDSPPGQRTVELGLPINLSDLAVTKRAGPMKFGAANVNTTNLTFQVNEKSCFIYATPQGYDYLAVEELLSEAQRIAPLTNRVRGIEVAAGELRPEAQWGHPLLPMKTFKVELNKEAEVLGLEVVEGTFREIKAELNLLPAPGKDWQIIADEKVYHASVLFPGRLVSIDHGADNLRQYVFARLFPVQYLPAKKRAMLLTQGTLELHYRSKGLPDAAAPDAGSKGVQGDRAHGLVTQAQCVVLCPSKLQSAAYKLSRFHAEQEGITSAVVTTEAIGQAYAPAEDPSYEGYQNVQLGGRDRIRNYDYALAKKIAAYLRDQPAHPLLVYVTILGDGLLVPPSYYFHSGVPDSLYEKWVPTDLFYGSPDYDLVPNFRIGRLSVNNLAEAAKVVDKVIRWHHDAEWSWFRNVQIAGFDSLNAEREGLFDGMKVKKCMPADDRVARVFIEPALAARDTGIFWCKVHGDVNLLAWPESILWANDLLRYSPHAKVPVIISIACDAGAFDLGLLKPSGDRGVHSFGEGILLSPAAGIAYFGSSRFSYGSVSYRLGQRQRVMVRERYYGELLYRILQSRRHGADTLGQLYADALFEFVSNNDMTGDPGNVFTAFEFVHLGDPALKIPVQP